ncbi:MAG TPA: FG-GAP-like repeat-containing protein [Burkholderiales bacterium]|nr:FG-GAP-like repeat-containing protein [Burkholderiales bacterium]
MSSGPSGRPTEASLIPNVLQSEDDGSITKATDTGITFGHAGLIQANATIGDGPFGSTTGDYDAYQVQVSAGYTLTAYVEAQVFKAGLDAAVDIYNSAGTLVASDDNTSSQRNPLDPFISYVAATSDTYTVAVRGGGRLANPFDSGSGAGAGSTGDYRIWIGSALNADDAQIVRGTNNGDTLTGGNGGDVFFPLADNRGSGPDPFDRVTGGTGNDLFVWYSQLGPDPGTYPKFFVDGGGGTNVVDAIGTLVSPNRTTLSAVSGTAEFQLHSGLDTRGFIEMTHVQGFDLHSTTSGDKFELFDLTGTSLTGSVRFFGNSGLNTEDARAATNPIAFYGGDGADTFIAGYQNGTSILDGGLGVNDTLSFAGFTAAALVDLRSSNQQNTHSSTGGTSIALASISNFESVVGSAFDDEIIGSPGSDLINGGPGNDRLTGGGAYPWGAPGSNDSLSDFTGDRKADVLQIEANGELDVWTSTGSYFNNANYWQTGARPDDKIGDFNGDAKTDVIQFNNDGSGSVWTSAGSSFNNRTFWGTGFTPSDRIADFNGDGQSDVIQIYNGIGYVWTSNGSSFNQYMAWGSSFTSDDRIADLNGDGKADMLQIFGGNVYVWTSNGNGFNAYTQWGAGATASDRLGDFNGDGQADLLQIFNGSAYIATSTGTGFNAFQQWGSGFTSEDRFADFNGDGKLDMLQIFNGRAYVAVSNGSGFSPYSQWGSGFQPTDQIADFNGDGKADLFQIYNGNGYVWLSNGNGFAPYTVWGNSGTGHDTFYFTGTFGHDTVTDFRPGVGGDVVRFDLGQVADFNTALANTFDDGHGNTVIHYDAAGNDTITLLHVAKSQLTADNFNLTATPV